MMGHILFSVDYSSNHVTDEDNPNSFFSLEEKQKYRLKGERQTRITQTKDLSHAKTRRKEKRYWPRIDTDVKDKRKQAYRWFRFSA
jgi:hypothetical protein